MTIFHCTIQYIIIGLIIILLAACSGGENGGTGFNNHPVVDVSNRGRVLEGETLTFSYTLPAEDTRANFAAYPEYASHVGNDIILALEKTHDPNYSCNYEIFYVKPNVSSSDQ